MSNKTMTLHSDDRPADAVITILFHGTQSYRHYREKIGCPNHYLECFQDDKWIDTEWTLIQSKTRHRNGSLNEWFFGLNTKDMKGSLT